MITIENFKKMDYNEPLLIKTITNIFVLDKWEIDNNERISADIVIGEEGAWENISGYTNFENILEIRNISPSLNEIPIMGDREKYEKLLKSGMFFEFFPNLTGNYEEDFSTMWEMLVS